jgi:hypothetical protein
MDEPTAGMAPKERNDLIALVKRLVIEKWHLRAVHRTFDGCGVRLRRSHHRVGARPADRRWRCEDRSATIRRCREVYFGTGKTFQKSEAHCMSTPMLSVENLGASYGAAQILYDLSLRGRARRSRCTDGPQRRWQDHDHEGHHGPDGAVYRQDPPSMATISPAGEPYRDRAARPRLRRRKTAVSSPI